MSGDHDAALRRLSKLKEFMIEWWAAFARCQASFDRFVALIGKPRPADPSWRRRIKAEIAAYETAGEAAQAVPVPAGTEAFHQQAGEVIQAFVEYEDSLFASALTGSKRQRAKAESARVRTVELCQQLQAQASMLQASIQEVGETRKRDDAGE